MTVLSSNNRTGVPGRIKTWPRHRQDPSRQGRSHQPFAGRFREAPFPSCSECWLRGRVYSGPGRLRRPLKQPAALPCGTPSEAGHSNQDESCRACGSKDYASSVIRFRSGPSIHRYAYATLDHSNLYRTFRIACRSPGLSMQGFFWKVNFLRQSLPQQ